MSTAKPLTKLPKDARTESDIEVSIVELIGGRLSGADADVVGRSWRRCNVVVRRQLKLQSRPDRPRFWLSVSRDQTDDHRLRRWGAIGLQFEQSVTQLRASSAMGYRRTPISFAAHEPRSSSLARGNSRSRRGAALRLCRPESFQSLFQEFFRCDTHAVRAS